MAVARTDELKKKGKERYRREIAKRRALNKEQKEEGDKGLVKRSSNFVEGGKNKALRHEGEKRKYKKGKGTTL